jgi:glyoxylase-like metal-dependent hydrolase (beta-lactamase superfamily II)
LGSRAGTAGELLPVADGVWCLRRPGRRLGAGPSCSYLVAADGGMVLVDPAAGTAEAAAGLRPVSDVLLTHCHGELGQAGAALRSAGARLHYHPAEAPLLGGRAGEADVLVRDGDVVAGAFQVVATPGHSPGHVCYFHTPTGSLFAGHALVVAGGELRLGARPAAADVPAARRSIARCLELPIKHVCPASRRPLSDGAGEKALAVRSRLLTGARWPLLG